MRKAAGVLLWWLTTACLLAVLVLAGEVPWPPRLPACWRVEAARSGW